MTLRIETLGETVEFSPNGVLNPDGTFSASGSIVRDEWTYSWSVQGASGPSTPFLSQGVGLIGELVNHSNAARSFSLSAKLPVSAVTPSSLAGDGYAMTFRDLNGDGAAFSTDPMTLSPFYTGLIDDVAFVTHVPAPFGLTADPGGWNGFVLPASFFPPVPAPAVHDSVGVRIAFNISSGDQINVQGGFSVQPVPEPGAAFGICFFAVSIVVVIRRARRTQRPILNG